jgi:putative (di)nucleoside polyphosphate hydrolase
MKYAVPNYAADHPAQKLAYRPCVGIVLFNDAGKVFSGHRKAAGLPDDAPRWQWPQGGMDEGETPIEAAYRELAEETGIRKASLLYEMPGWLTYDLPEDIIGKALKGKFRGQKQKWFAFRFEGSDADICLDGHEQIEFESWAWRSLEDCVDRVIAFKRPVYEAVSNSFTHLQGLK